MTKRIDKKKKNNLVSEGMYIISHSKLLNVNVPIVKTTERQSSEIEKDVCTRTHSPKLYDCFFRRVIAAAYNN